MLEESWWRLRRRASLCERSCLICARVSGALREVVSLAVEAMDEIKVAHRDQALGALRDLQKRQLHANAREPLSRRWRAVHLPATAGVAADHYAQGTFGPSSHRRQ